MNPHNTLFYIDGAWVEPLTPHLHDVINPATEKPSGQISFGTAADVNRAVLAARRAFPAFAATSREERLGLLERIVAGFRARGDEIARTMTLEMGTPISFAKQTQNVMALGNFLGQIEVLKDYPFDRIVKGSLIRREPIGVCGLITPWNWPLNQVTAKLSSALAAGCTVLLKPSEISPLSCILLAEILHDAGVPPGVFNLVNGDGPGVGAAISAHPDIDMVSFTGSTRAGVLIAKAAADTVKRVTQELGGKSPNVILGDADLEKAVTFGVLRCFTNTGQSCQAPTRMVIPRSKHAEVLGIAKKVAATVRIGDPLDPATTMGPLANRAQFDKVNRLIETGVSEGATLVTGGPGRPEGHDRGYFVRPTIFADVKRDMTIVREEIFGPVLVIQDYDTEEEAIAIANDTTYGLAGYVQGRDLDRVKQVAARIRAGRVYLNGATADESVPFGGFKGSGNGREKGVFGLEEYLEVKAIVGYQAA